MMNSVIQQIQANGNIPLPRFGHSVTAYDRDKICLFGGATGTTGQFSITDNIYTLDISRRLWDKVQTTGISPSARAAHGAVCVEQNKIIIYGGATGSGGLASDDLFHLDLRQKVGIWNIINVTGKTPGKRYGHTLTFSKPYLVVFGGNIGDRTVSDCWILNIQGRPLQWTEVKCQGQNPCPRVYHSAALCSAGSASGMIVVFGGRASNNEPLNDSWGLRRHRRGHWDWVRAPQKTSPSARYQHSGLFMGTLMIIMGGKTNNVHQTLKMEVFDTQTSQWYGFNSPQRFRHGCWVYEKSLFVYGGFELTAPTIPTNSIFKVNLSMLFHSNPALHSKVVDLNSSVSSVSSNTSGISNRSQTRSDNQTNRTQARTADTHSQYDRKSKTPNQMQEQYIPGSRKKRRVVMMQPIIGSVDKRNKTGFNDVRKPLTSKQDIPHMFLNQLMHPNSFKNAQTLKVSLKPEHIIMLCDLAQQIIVRQPMVLSVKAPLKIFGDVHGQFTDLMTFFDLYGTPHQNGQKKDIQHYDYIFLGDFVDRGSHSLQTICLLLALKVVYPEQIHLIRGNHEDSQININFGFRDQCAQKLETQDPDNQNSVFMRINRLFDWLPLAAVAQDKILCLHGGIGASLSCLQDIQRIRRPLQVMHEVQDEESQLVLDILWSDPTDSDSQLGISPNYLRDPAESGNIVKFGPDRVQDFLKKNNLSMIIRAHECVMDGFQRFAGGSLITVFSATDYCRRHKNAGAILIIKTNLQIIPKLIYPNSSNANNWIEDQQQLKKRPPTPPRWRNQR